MRQGGLRKGEILQRNAGQELGSGGGGCVRYEISGLILWKLRVERILIQIYLKEC